ncbi:cell division protein FtsZ [Mesomycoplasma neurolyticum]|uniref:Cell division protein FtsZ n=1 Tax=Mesomycoplasma neurolyticum TaxID=2120 RepID=A0A449A4S6_9BACT|nr:cell division protein FtsZ [Mesomycoplasma neurolyticum]VEU59239.1 cell division protein FtsZ [Mesomycoplasma neurolyticum]
MSNRKIKIFGIGGCGNNIVKHALENAKDNIEYYFANTDLITLNTFDPEKTIALGDSEKRKGSGAGNDPLKGREYALESKNEISEKMAGADIVVLAAGMGKGTGSGSSSIFAEEAKKHGALTIAIVTMPFEFEGKKISGNAALGLANLKKHVDALLIISNNKLATKHANLPHFETMKIANVFFDKIINVIYEIINVRGIQNVDFADLLSIMKTKGEVIINSVKGFGSDKVQKAIDKLLEFDILENNIKKAKNIILNIASADITSAEISEIINRIKKESENEVDVIYGLIQKSSNDKDLSLSIIATGINEFNSENKTISSTITNNHNNVSRENVSETPKSTFMNTKTVLNEHNTEMEKPSFSSITEAVRSQMEKKVNNNENSLPKIQSENSSKIETNFRSMASPYANNPKVETVQTNTNPMTSNSTPSLNYDKLRHRMAEKSSTPEERTTNVASNYATISQKTREETLSASGQKTNNHSSELNYNKPNFFEIENDNDETEENYFPSFLRK